MTMHTDDAMLLGGTFSEAAPAQDAFGVLMDEAGPGAAELDIAFYGSRGEFRVLVAARSCQAEDWAVRVLREHGATVEQEKFQHWLSDVRNRLTLAAAPAKRPARGERELVADWAAAVLLVALERGLVEPSDLLALLVASGGRVRRQEVESPDEPAALAPDERRRRLTEADAELREVGGRVEAALRSRYPELFDRRGRLRRAALAQRLNLRTAGKRTLSGDELFALEEAADAEAARPAHAP